jgi:hypothetical protein
MRLRRRRGLGIGARGTRPGHVRAAHRLDVNVASRHAAILDNVLDRELGVASGVKFSDDRALQGSLEFVPSSTFLQRAEFQWSGATPTDAAGEQWNRCFVVAEHMPQEGSQDCHDKSYQPAAFH